MARSLSMQRKQTTTYNMVSDFRKQFYDKTTEHWISVNTKDKTTGQYLHQIFIAKTRTLWKLHEFEWKMYDVYEDFPIVDFKDARPFATMLDVAEWFTKPEEERNALRAAGKVPNKIYAIATHSGFEKGLLNMALAKKTEKSPAERVMSPIMPAKAAKIFGISPLDQLGAAIASNPRRGYPVADTVSQPIRTLVSPFMVTVSDLVKKDYKVELAKQVDGSISRCNSIKANGVMRIFGSSSACIKERVCQRIGTIETMKNTWKTRNRDDTVLREWLRKDAAVPVNNHRFLTFEYYHFLPSHLLTTPPNCEFEQWRM